MLGRTFVDLVDLNAQARHWMTVANNKVHGTTGQIPPLELPLEKLKELPQDGRHLEYPGSTGKLQRWFCELRRRTVWREVALLRTSPKGHF